MNYLYSNKCSLMLLIFRDHCDIKFKQLCHFFFNSVQFVFLEELLVALYLIHAYFDGDFLLFPETPEIWF